jgi:hypothetical protein
MSHLDNRDKKNSEKEVDSQRRIAGTLGDMLLAVTAAYTHTIDNISLLCFVSKPASLIRS